MRTAAILPVKRFAEAKSRLGASVGDPVRSDLARAMVGDVLTALGETTELERTIVVTGEDSVARAAAYLGALVVDDTTDDGQSAAVSLGVRAALASGFERVLCIPGDCPALDPLEIDKLLRPARAGARGPEVTIVPDRHGIGTNALLLSPPDAIAPSFGPGSCERHRELAARACVGCHIERPASLLLDIDTGEDLAALRERLAGEHVRAPRTRAVLVGASASGATPSRPPEGASGILDGSPGVDTDTGSPSGANPSPLGAR